MVSLLFIALNLLCLGHAAAQEACAMADSKSCAKDGTRDADVSGLLQAKVETSKIISDKQPKDTDKVLEMAKQFGITDFTLLIGDESGILSTVTGGQAIPTNIPIPVFSAGKWQAAAALGGAIKQGKFGWDDKVSQYIPWWPTDANDARSEVTFRRLMSLSSGLVMSARFAEAMGWDEATVQGWGLSAGLIGLDNVSSTLEQSVRNIMSLSSKEEEADPDEFRYGETHFLVAAYAALRATGESTWKDFAQRYWADPLGIASTDFDFEAASPDDDIHGGVPNVNNPNPGGDLKISADTYAKVLTSYVKDGENLFGSNELDTAQATKCAFSIMPDSYALGHWIHLSTPRILHSFGFAGVVPAVTTINGKKYWIYLNRYQPGDSQASLGFVVTLVTQLPSFITTP